MSLVFSFLDDNNTPQHTFHRPLSLRVCLRGTSHLQNLFLLGGSEIYSLLANEHRLRTFEVKVCEAKMALSTPPICQSGLVDPSCWVNITEMRRPVHQWSCAWLQNVSAPSENLHIFSNCFYFYHSFHGEMLMKVVRLEWADGSLTVWTNAF